jgi:hypothetical protein
VATRFELTSAPQNYLLPNRHASHSVEPWTFLSWMREHRHPRWSSCGVDVTRFGDEARKIHNIQPHGTIWFSNTEEREVLYPIACNSIPYFGDLSATWNEEKRAWEGGELTRGWRRTLWMLANAGYLYPSDDLTFLIGEDSWKLVPRRFWE